MTRRALLVHGLQSSPLTWWRVAGWLRDDGWDVEVASLLGHAERGPAPDYSFAAYAADLDDGSDRDLVIAHSLGGAAAITASDARPSWAARLVLVDPAILVPDDQRDAFLAGLEEERAATAETLRAANPGWTPEDLDAKVAALAGAEPRIATSTVDANEPWDIRDAASRLAVPTLLVTGDPAIFTMDPPPLVEALVAANPRIEYRVVPGAGHSPQRDRPEDFRMALLSWLAATD